MASEENSHSPPTTKLAEPNNQGPSPSTIVPMTSSRSSKKNGSTDEHSAFPSVSTGKQTSVKAIPINYLRHRLCIRELYYTRLTVVSNVMSFLAIFGIVLMVIENELTFNRVNNQDTKVSWFIKLIITITTAILLVLILYYHHTDMSLYSFRNSLEDWRIELTSAKILMIAVEVLICAIHPMPRSYPQSDPEKINSSASDASSPDPYPLSYTSIDVGLGLPMFLRLYLLGRSIVLHSHLVRDLSLRSLGYLNQVSINFFFLMKTYLEQWPTRCLMTICTMTFSIGSWSLRACNYTNTREHLSMSNSMWLFIVTFTTVGYGDQYPSTLCGRTIAAMIGLIGLLSSALLIAILTKKLLLTREEKYVHTFVLNTQITKELKHQAANVIKFAMKTWYLKRKDRSTSIQHFQAQRKLFRSIHCVQQIRQRRRNLVDNCIGFSELMTMHRDTSARTEETAEQIAEIRTEVKRIEEKLNNMHRSMETLQNTLNVLLDTVAK